MTPPKDILNVSEAADYLGVSASWLWKSDVPRARLGKRVVWIRSQLLAYAEARLTHRIDQR